MNFRTKHIFENSFTLCGTYFPSGLVAKLKAIFPFVSSDFSFFPVSTSNISTFPSAEPVRIYFESLENSTVQLSRGPESIDRFFSPVSKSQMLMLESRDEEAKNFPDGSTTTDTTPNECPSSVLSNVSPESPYFQT